MVSICIFFISVSLFSLTSSALQNSSDENLSITQFIRKYGYPAESHQITTKDGYILTTHRIPHGRGSKVTGSKVALLAHGMGGSAENFISIGPNKALAFILADRGFDVWLFNARGNAHSRRHITLRPNLFQAAAFWKFSWHEIGIYDLPGNIDYILRKTRKSQLFYIGHSQGATSYYVMTSEKPEYNSKITVAALMAPPIIMDIIDNFLFKIVSTFHPILEKFADYFSYHELPIPNYPLLKKYLKAVCLANEDFIYACTNLLYYLAGQDSGLINSSLLPLILTYSPSSFASRQALHYAQEIKSGKFRKYDYGVTGNLIKYNQSHPPEYNLNNSIAPVAHFFGGGDCFSSPRVKDRLASIIPNVVMSYVVPYDRFSHYDFLWGSRTQELVYEAIYELFMKFEK